MNVFVIGSNSFTASNLIDLLLSKTDYNIFGFSRSPEYENCFLAYKKNIKKNRFKFFQANINKDIDFFKEKLNELKPNIIYYYAAQGEVRNSWKHPEHWWQTNALGVVKFTNLLLGYDNLQKFIMCSTPEVYGDKNYELKEDVNYDPSTPYAASKLAGDLHLRCLFKKYNFPVVFTRSSNVYGRYQQLYRIIPKSIIKILKNEKILLHNNGKTVRSFVHIRDVSEAVYELTIKGKNGEVYHIDNYKEKPISLKNLLHKICDYLNVKFEDFVEFTDENFGQDNHYYLNCEKIKNEIQWEPKVSLDKGIVDVINWIKNNWNELKDKSLEYVHKE